MSTKYNPYEAINAIFNYKGEWDKANATGDSTGKTNAAQNAVKFYEELKANGYGDVADTLKQSNYKQAQYINDYYKSIQEAAKPRTSTTEVQQENEKLFANYNREYEDLKSTNPFETAEGKAILAKYDLAGLQGRDNQAAVGGATNGGNIDSYAAANALRQQAALVNQGQQTVLGAYQQKLDHARNLLSDMGVNIDRVYNQNETTKLNDFAIEAEKAKVSGYTPSSWIEGSTNAFLNADGTLKSEYLTEEFDNAGGFAAIIATAEKAGNTELLYQAKVARGKKILGDYAKYGQYDDGNYELTGKTKTEEARQFDKSNALVQAEMASNKETDAQNRAVELLTLAAKYEISDPDLAKNLKTMANSLLSGVGGATAPPSQGAEAGNATNGIKHVVTPSYISGGQSARVQGAPADFARIEGASAQNEQKSNSQKNVTPTIDKNGNSTDDEGNKKNVVKPANYDLIDMVLSTATSSEEAKNKLGDFGVTDTDLDNYYIVKNQEAWLGR